MTINEMFTKLKDNIGNYVKCTYWYNEELITKIIKLDRVDDYDSIFDSDFIWIHFITENEYIISIETIDGKVLYENKLFEKEFKNISSKEELYKKQRLVFGSNYISKEEINYLIKKGLDQIEPIYEEEWIKFVNSNSNYERIKIIKATISMLEKINKGMDYYLAEMKVYTSEFILDGNEMQEVTDAISIFFKHRKSFISYRNRCTSDNKSKKKILSKK